MKVRIRRRRNMPLLFAEGDGIFNVDAKAYDTNRASITVIAGVDCSADSRVSKSRLARSQTYPKQELGGGEWA